MEADELREQVEELVARSQKAIVDASRRLADGITAQADRRVPTAGEDLSRLVDEAFDFAQRVIEEQRKMLAEVLKTVSEALGDAADSAATTAKKVAKKAPAKKAPAKKAPAKKAPAKKAAAKKAPAKKAPAKKAAAKKAPAKKQA